MDLPEVLGARAGRAQELAGQLVPELRDRARQRAGRRRQRSAGAARAWSRSASSSSGTSRSPTTPSELLDDLDELPGWPERVKSDAGQLDRPQRGRRGRVRALRRGRRAHRRAHHRVHDAPGHAVRLHVLPARAGAPARRASSSRAREYADAVNEVVASAARETAVERQLGERDEARRVHRPLRRSTRSTASRSRSGSPTTCSWTTAPARSWRCPAATSATSSSRASTACRSSPVVVPAEQVDALSLGGSGRGAAGGRLGRGVRAAPA